MNIEPIVDYILSTYDLPERKRQRISYIASRNLRERVIFDFDSIYRHIDSIVESLALRRDYKIISLDSLASKRKTPENLIEKFLKDNKIDVVIHAAVKGGSRKLPSYQGMSKENLKMFFNLASNSKYYKKMIFLGSGAEYDKSIDIKEAKESDFGKRIPLDDYVF